MNKEQWRAVYAYCEEEGYERPSDMLASFKMWGIVDERATMEDLAESVNGDGYNTMLEFLRGCGS